MRALCKKPLSGSNTSIRKDRTAAGDATRGRPSALFSPQFIGAAALPTRYRIRSSSVPLHMLPITSSRLSPAPPVHPLSTITYTIATPLLDLPGATQRLQHIHAPTTPLSPPNVTSNRPSKPFARAPVMWSHERFAACSLPLPASMSSTRRRVLARGLTRHKNGTCPLTHWHMHVFSPRCHPIPPMVTDVCLPPLPSFTS
ncbi:hypothetical protein C8J57DRAFT_1574860 [Mycena rebaudengoi]|nr:hypothetical protein C8J57DRAFT_1574860 [Mycena rebaudengoi]